MLSIIKLENGSLESKPSGNLLKHEDYRAYMAHRDVEAYSKQRAKKRYKSVDALVEEERSKGYQAGLKAGEKEAASKVLALNLSAIAYLKAFEQQAGEIIQDALQRILGEMDQDTLIQSLVGTAIKAVETEQQIKIIVSYHDVKAVKARVEHWLEQYPNIERINVIADNQMAAKSCRLETPIGVVDAGLQTQLKALRMSMESVFGVPEEPEERQNSSFTDIETITD
ncbi:hypothetical protein SG34_032380 [Thalassomonas viridans]|uniref:Flagellar assembly protein FliH/Type III secretion system HrpE domain-containing protein n=1 Tax=Thalassomonas viridans TaxID=137584 RepID=A0AAE9Z9J8_9GAMM|nr:FliH/SctL family protein [Thalassomonas viridans]WDE08619.1 hypothetical protein SG34_032380 [Thalassomonas viridans]